MEGTYSQTRAAGEKAIEEVMRGITHVKKGLMRLQRRHVNKAISTNKKAREIGKGRADKVWAWVAEATKSGRHLLKDTSQWTNAWLGDEEITLLIARGEAAWRPLDPALSARACREEVVGAVRAWLHENEERGQGTVMRVRPQKLTQLRGAKKAMAKKRGGTMAIYSALVLLAAEGRAVLAQRPQKPSRQGEWTTWILDAVTWMEHQGWILHQEAVEVQQGATHLHEQHLENKKSQVIVDFGEGWRGVGWGITEAFPDIEVVGVDRRGFTNTGAKGGIIISAVQHEFQEESKVDILTAVAKKVGSPVAQWLMAFVCLDCSPHSIVNAMNQPKGAAHGEWSQTQQNRNSSTGARQAQELEWIRESATSARRMLEGLEAHPGLLFALENPFTSRLWELAEVLEVCQRNPAWRKIRVDQCAYGRKSQKPTYILTNIKGWKPRGLTGSGRCVLGTCAGTLGNSRGDARHAEQTVPNSKDRRPDQGALVGGRRERTREAVVNEVVPGLVTEIVAAALQQYGAAQGLKQGQRRRRTREREEHESPPSGGCSSSNVAGAGAEGRSRINGQRNLGRH